MDRIRTDITGGLPFDLPDLAKLQDTYEAAIHALARGTVGTNAIVSGCEIDGLDVAPGFVYLNSELLYHPGSTLDTLTNDPYFYKNTRTANAVVTQLGETIDSWLIKEALASSSQSQGVQLMRWIPVSFNEVDVMLQGPIGEVKMWVGALANFDSTGLGSGSMKGWALANGQNGTVNLQDRFPLGFKPGDTVGGNVGSNQISVAVNNMPSHKHNVAINSGGLHKHNFAVATGLTTPGAILNVETSDTIGFFSETAESGEHSHTVTENNTGGGQPITHTPKSTIVAYIQRIS